MAESYFCTIQTELQEGVVDSAEGVADLGSEQAHDRDYNDSDESENDGVLN